MPYYRGTKVPDCFSRWCPADPECDICTVEAMCCKVTEEKESREKKSGTTSTSTNKTSFNFDLPDDDDILPKDGESPVLRLFKNVLVGVLKEVGVQMAIFFKKWKMP